MSSWEKKPWRCLACGGAFVSHRSLIRHFESAHPALLPEWFWEHRQRGLPVLSSSILAELEARGLAARGSGAPAPPPQRPSVTLSFDEVKRRVLLILSSRRPRSKTFEVKAARVAEEVFGLRRKTATPVHVDQVVRAALELGRIGPYNVLLRACKRGAFIVLTLMPPEVARRVLPDVLDPEEVNGRCRRK
jgi:hypothetical protein